MEGAPRLRRVGLSAPTPRDKKKAPRGAFFLSLRGFRFDPSRRRPCRTCSLREQAVSWARVHARHGAIRGARRRRPRRSGSLREQAVSWARVRAVTARIREPASQGLLDARGSYAVYTVSMFEFKTVGTCSTKITFRIVDGRLRDIRFFNGCDGNLKAIARLLEDQPAAEAAVKLKGIRCGPKRTSCADQLAIAIERATGSA